jgi:hypothetical protein
VPADKVAGAMEQARQLKATDKEIAAAIEEVFAARRGERAVSEGTT